MRLTFGSKRLHRSRVGPECLMVSYATTAHIKQTRRASWRRLTIALTVACLASPIGFAQRVVRITEADAINPAEVSIAINPKNPANIVAASFQTGRLPRPRTGSYNYVSMDGGKTWKTIPVEDPKGLTQGDDTVYFSADGSAYHAHLSFVGIRVPKPSRAESGILVESSK